MELRALIHSLRHSALILKRPSVIGRVIKGLNSTIVLGRPRLKIVEFVVNSECNSECIMCYATRYNKEGEVPLSPIEIGNVWRQCQELGAFIAAVEGGEPTMRRDILDILVALEPFKNIVVLVSNSLNLNKEWLFKLKQAGVSVLHLSLDSADPEKNDVIRGAKGHFKKVMEVVKEGRKLGFTIYFSTIFRHSNREEFLKVIELARSLKVGVSGALVVTMGRYADHDEERLTEEDRLWLLSVLKKYPSIVRFDWNNNLSGRYECPAGREKISVSMYGDIMACVCNHLAFGNVRKESVGTIWRRMCEFSYFKERNERCLVSFDTPYRKGYIDSIVYSPVLPVSIFEHPRRPATLTDDGLIKEGGTNWSSQQIND